MNQNLIKSKCIPVQNHIHRTCNHVYRFIVYLKKKKRKSNTFMQHCHEVWKWKRVQCSLVYKLNRIDWATYTQLLARQTHNASKQKKTKQAKLPQIHNVNTLNVYRCYEIKSRIKFKRKTYYNKRVTFATYAYTYTQINQKYCLFIFFSIFRIHLIEPSWEC